MKKPDIAKCLARDTGLSEAEAADRLDRIVDQILHAVKNGKPARLPGLGRFLTGPDGRLAFENDRRKRHE